jgi:hypothetical protein
MGVRPRQVKAGLSSPCIRSKARALVVTGGARACNRPLYTAAGNRQGNSPATMRPRLQMLSNSASRLCRCALTRGHTGALSVASPECIDNRIVHARGDAGTNRLSHAPKRPEPTTMLRRAPKPQRESGLGTCGKPHVGNEHDGASQARKAPRPAGLRRL